MRDGETHVHLHQQERLHTTPDEECFMMSTNCLCNLAPDGSGIMLPECPVHGGIIAAARVSPEEFSIAKNSDPDTWKHKRVIKIIGLINGAATEFDDQYVVQTTPNLVTTPNVEQATRYSVGDAIQVWRAVDPDRPVRADGRPNRPLTAYTVQIMPPEPPEKEVLQ